MTMTEANPVWLGIANVAVLPVDASNYVASLETWHVFVLKTPETFTYDADGNLLSDGWWNYTWDAENRLIKVESRPDTPSSSWRRIEWTYDALGRRIQQVTSIWTNNAWFVVENLKFVSEPMLFGRHIVELNSTNNTLVRSYVWGLDLSGTMDSAGGVGGLAWVTLHTASGSASGTHFVCYDGNGNIVALVSATTGDVTARYEFGPFGEPIRITGPAATMNPFRFSTKRTDDTTDLVLYEYRVYQSSTGRWLSRDPIGERRGLNLYGFVGNSTINSIDLFGLMTRAECQDLRGQIFRKAPDLLDDLRRYDPVADGQGGFPKHGGGVTKPGGHFDEIIQRKRGLRNDITRYLKECIKCDDDQGPKGGPVPRWIDEIVSRPIPPPVYPLPNLIIYVPGSDGFWESVGTGGLIASEGALIGIGIIVSPEISIPVLIPAL
jgi:RHS repeat-associated protein